MAASTSTSTSTLLHSLFNPNPSHLLQTTPNPSHLHLQTRPQFSIKCITNPNPNPNSTPELSDSSFPSPSSETTIPPESFPIEKRRRSEIIRDPKSRTGLAEPEPPNFEIGWKRTKEIKVEKPKGFVIADFLEKLEELMGKEFGSTELLAKVGEIVSERAREEAEVLREKGEVEERMITELFRVLRLMEMDLVMVKAAVKEETLTERLEQAKARCRQAILVALSF